MKFFDETFHVKILPNNFDVKSKNVLYEIF